MQTVSFRREMKRAAVAVGLQPLLFSESVVWPAVLWVNRCSSNPTQVRLCGEIGDSRMTMQGLSCVENCLNCHLRSRNFFCDLSQDSIEVLSKIKHAAVFPEHAVVLVEGQSPFGIFILCQGRAKLSTTSREGKTLILRIAEAGEVLGLDAVVTGKPHEFTVETMRPCQLNYVGREDLLRFLKDHADACLHATQHLAQGCSDSYGLVRSIGLSRVSDRLANFLLDTASDGKITNGAVRVRLGLSHEEISQVVGTNRETITRLLSEFKKNELAEINGATLIIHNLPALRSRVRA